MLRDIKRIFYKVIFFLFLYHLTYDGLEHKKLIYN
jgi:hypothetical protein